MNAEHGGITNAEAVEVRIPINDSPTIFQCPKKSKGWIVNLT